jgi:acyl-CoA reductase-like NAD-dependent aldehyde dehydrogenase
VVSSLPEQILNWIDNRPEPAVGQQWFDKLNPADGQRLCQVARSQSEDVQAAVASARRAQPAWAALPPVKRGHILHDVTLALRERRDAVARIVALETGKSYKAALGETDGAIELGLFMAGEGQRLYGRTTTSGTPHRYAMTVRQPCGVAGLIIAANTPIANVAWKVFPALVCGNSAVLKAAEDTPATAWIFATLAHAAGLPPGVLNVVQGYGEEAGAPLVAHPDVAVVSFTGSTAVGRHIARTTRPGGCCSRPSATPASAAPRAAGSSSSTRFTTGSARCWWNARGSCGSGRPTKTILGRSSMPSNWPTCSTAWSRRAGRGRWCSPAGAGSTTRSTGMDTTWRRR